MRASKNLQRQFSRLSIHIFLLLFPVTNIVGSALGNLLIYLFRKFKTSYFLITRWPVNFQVMATAIPTSTASITSTRTQVFPSTPSDQSTMHHTEYMRSTCVQQYSSPSSSNLVKMDESPYSSSPELARWEAKLSTRTLQNSSAQAHSATQSGSMYQAECATMPPRTQNSLHTPSTTCQRSAIRTLQS